MFPGSFLAVHCGPEMLLSKFIGCDSDVKFYSLFHKLSFLFRQSKALLMTAGKRNPGGDRASLLIGHFAFVAGVSDE